jgi:ribonuclease-3
MADAAALARRLGHEFADPDLLVRALTHPSTPEPSYERMEFLGDRVLGLVIADMLFHRFPGESEGDMARRHAKLVNRDSLAQVARDIGIGEVVRISDKTRPNDAILADCCEAVLAALYLDGGIAPARRFIELAWEPLIAADAVPPRDPKTALQIWALGKGLALPEYSLVSQEGPPHARAFTVEVAVAGQGPARGQGRSKREAERAAAQALLARLDR